MRNVVVAGAGMAPFAKYADRGVRSLAEEAVSEALVQANLQPGQIEAAYFSNAVAGLITGQEMIRGQAALRYTGLSGIPMCNVENACASASTAFHLAWTAVAGGLYDVAIAVGSEKLSHPDKKRSFRAIGTAVDIEWMVDVLEKLGMHEQAAELRGDSPASGGSPGGSGAAAKADGSASETDSGKAKGKEGGGHSLFMEFYAAAAKGYMAKSGATAEDFADVAVKNRKHASLNPKAQFRKIVDRDDVLSSRLIADPLTLLMCSPIGDGAAAAILCSEEAARKLGIINPVRVLASILGTGKDVVNKGEPNTVERAVARAYDAAGVGPEDLDVIELHDAAAPAELIVYEELGLCAKGEGPALLAKGDTALGGSRPVNTSGGLLSKGHPVGATGLAQIAEVTWQLQGRADQRQVEGAKVALCENAGGFLGTESAATCIHIFGV
ncbi:MAG: thiolase family protein [Acidimicrobiales bacterium]